MYTLKLQREDVYLRLLEKAKSEGTTLDDLLDHWLDQNRTRTPEPDELLRQFNQKLYAKARSYWQEHGNMERLVLTDAELDEQFWLFDEDDIPRLKADAGMFEFVETPGMKLARLVEEAALEVDSPFDARDAEAVLNEEMGEHLWRNLRDQHETKDSGG